MDKDRIRKIRADFSYLKIKEGRLIYLDNAATTQKPTQVLDDYLAYYRFSNGNPHRGSHYLSMRATDAYEQARAAVASFINAASSKEIVFVRNATEGLNLIARSFGQKELGAGDEVLISILEHHANLIPWQEISKKTGARLRYLYLDDDRQIPWEEFLSKVNEHTKVLSLTAASNVTGTMPDFARIIPYVRKKNPETLIVVDAAQAVGHRKMDVRALDCDFLVFSGHKMLAPTGIGVVYGKKEKLNALDPVLFGGDMIEYVYEDRASYLEAPERFETGTQNVAGAHALQSAMSYLLEIGLDEIEGYEKQLTDYCDQKLRDLPFVEVYSTSASKRSPLVTFNVRDVHPHDTASILDSKGVAIRSGHHCAQPLHRYLGIPSSCRASFAFYNTFEEIDILVENLYHVRKVMRLEP